MATLLHWFTHQHLMWIAYGILYLAIQMVLTRKSQIDAWCEANPKRASLMKAIRSLCPDPWMMLQALALLFRGRLPAGYMQLFLDNNKPESIRTADGDKRIDTVRPPPTTTDLIYPPQT
jgi:hypothetical protein